MHSHPDPIHHVYIDLDKIDKGDLYDKYAQLVEKYRDLRLLAHDMLGVIDDLYDEQEDKEIIDAYIEFRDESDNATPLTPALLALLKDDDGNALRVEPTYEEGYVFDASQPLKEFVSPISLEKGNK